jgi:hypothetical protein
MEEISFFNRQSCIIPKNYPFGYSSIFPCFDQPSLNGKITLSVNHNDDYRVISSGDINRVEKKNGRPTKYVTTCTLEASNLINFNFSFIKNPETTKTKNFNILGSNFSVEIIVHKSFDESGDDFLLSFVQMLIPELYTFLQGEFDEELEKEKITLYFVNELDAPNFGSTLALLPRISPQDQQTVLINYIISAFTHFFCSEKKFSAWEEIIQLELMKELLYRRFIQINIYSKPFWTQEFVYFNLSKGFTTCSIESKPGVSNYECKLKVNNLYSNILGKVADYIELNEISDILKVFIKVQYDKEEDWLFDYWIKRSIELTIIDDKT